VTGQRDRLYAAEDRALGYGGFYSTVEAAQMEIDSMLRTKWWKDRCGIKYVRAVYPARGLSGAVKDDETHGHIDFSPARMCESTLYHEMSHFIAGMTKGQTPKDHEKDHGPGFARTLLDVHRRFNSAAMSAKLEWEFEENGVKVA
jgi:hypothetical protein